MKFLNRICAFALFLAVAHSQPGAAQGLIGMYPDGYSSWEQYMQHEHMEAEQIEKDGKFIEFLHDLGFASLAPALNHAYAESLVKQAWAWESARELKKVERCYRKALEVEDDQFSLQSDMDRYAQVLCSLDRHVEEKLWRKKLAALEAEYYGIDSPLRRSSLRDLARCYAELKEADNQIETLQQIVSLLEHARASKAEDYHYWEESSSAGELARAMEQHGDVERAQTNFKLALSSLDPDCAGSWNLLEASNELAQFYLRHGHPEKAEPLLKKATQLWVKNKDWDWRSHAKEALTSYASLLARTHRPAEARQVKSELARIESMERW